MSHYYFNAMLGSKILTYCTILNKIEQNKIKMAQKCLSENSFCQKWQKPW